MTGKVIAISGPPGAGKSTLGRWLAQTHDAARIDYDDYEEITQKPPSEIADWLARGSPMEEITAPGLADKLDAARGRGAVIFETPLGRAWADTEALIDVLIWIDTPLDLALSRKLLLMARMAADSPQNAPDYAAWMAGYLEAYAEVTRPSLVIQNARVKSGADINILNVGTVLDAQNAIDLALREWIR